MLTAGRNRELRVSWQLSGHARRLVTVALAGLALAVVTRRPEFAGLAAPAVLLLLARQASQPPAVAVEVAAGTEPVTEGELSAVRVRIPDFPAGQLQLRLHPAGWITADDARPGADGWYQLPFRAERWGTRQIGTLEVIVHDRWRLAVGQLPVSLPTVTCYPRPARLDSLVLLSRLPARLGEHSSRRPGEGIEFAGVREFVPGDRQRRINWPATTRRGTLQLNTFTAERAQTVVVLVDLSADVGPAGRSSADLAVRAGAGVAARYLAARDRVGLITFSNQLHWVSPAAGRRQADRIMRLIMTSPQRGHSLDVLAALPRTTLPPGALVIAFSPLLTISFIEAVRDLRERGFATIVVDVLNAQPGAGLARNKATGELARRVWRMEQEAIRFSLRQIGVPVVHWDGTSALDQPLAPFLRRPVVQR